ncbi:hypothetical protein ANA_C10668 [Anabaena sp. 90]|nr:hypothetical protein ANA_C10668 [Anabaena sp. 90]
MCNTSRGASREFWTPNCPFACFWIRFKYDSPLHSYYNICRINLNHSKRFFVVSWHYKIGDSLVALYAIAPQHPQNAIAHNYPNFKRFLGRASLSHPNTPKQRFLGRASLSLTTTLILNELLAAAQRLRSPNLFLNGDSCGALRYRSQPP